MARKYGEEQRVAADTIRENLLNQLQKLYLKTFQEIMEAELGAGTTTKLTQLFLLSRDGAITPLIDKKKI